MNTTAPNSPIDPAYDEADDRRILVVDDEEPVRRLFVEYLNQTNSCASAANAQEALELLSQESFALVITDIQMPGLGGIELLRKVTERYPDTAVIIVSGVDPGPSVLAGVSSSEGALGQAQPDLAFAGAGDAIATLPPLSLTTYVGR